MSGFGATVVAAVVVGCGGAVTARHWRPFATDGALTAPDFVLVAAAGPTPMERPVMSTAESRLTKRCMMAAGFRFYPGAPLAESPVRRAIDLYTVSGRPAPERVQLAARRRYGYGLFALATPSGEAAASGGINARRDAKYVAALTPTRRRAYETALYGRRTMRGTVTVEGANVAYATAGCHALTTRKLYGSDRAAAVMLATAEGTFRMLNKRINSNRHIAYRITSWSRCVHAASGRRFTDPNAIVSWLRHRYAITGPTGGIHRLETRLSLIDGRCQYKTRLAQDYSATFRRLANHLSGSAAAAVRRAAAIEHSAFSRARALRSARG